MNDRDAAKRADRGPDFISGAGKAEPCVMLYGPPRYTNQDYWSLGLTPKEVDKNFRAAHARLDQRRMDGLPIGASRFGGVADLPPDLAWPTLEGKKLPFLAQFDLSGLPKSLLPPTGWLFVFGLFDDLHEPEPVIVLHHPAPRSALVRAQRPAGNEIWTDWYGSQIYDVWPLVPTVQTDREDEDSDDATPPPGIEKGWKTAGWLFGEIDEAGESAKDVARDLNHSGDDWITLLVICSVGSMEWSDGGVVQVAIRRQDLAKHDFTQVCATICCSC